MSTRKPLTAELRTLTRMSVPVVGAQLGSMAMGVVDTIMVGHLDDATALPAVALGDLWVFGSLVIGLGVMMGLDPIVSQAHGAEEGERAGRALQNGVALALLSSLPLMFVWSFAEDALVFAHQDPELARKAQIYTHAQIFSAAPILVFTALRHYLQGRGFMAVALWITVFANAANVLFNWALIYGHLGFPRLGILGAGIATGLTRVVMMVALIAWVMAFRLHHGAWVPWSRASWSLSGVRSILRSGIPVGIQFGLEVWAFQIAMLFAGHLGAVTGDEDGTVVASHSITMKLASVSFMVPFGISIATATRVGNLIGARNTHAAQRTAWVALGLGGGVMLGSAVIFVFGRHWLPTIFTRDAATVGLSALVLPVAAAFQLFDGVQVVGGGVLRGMGNTRPAAVFNLVGYYFLALPVGWWLTFRLDFGLAGIWWGLCVGLGVVAALLVLWIAWRGPGCLDDAQVLSPDRAR